MSPTNVLRCSAVGVRLETSNTEKMQSQAVDTALVPRRRMLMTALISVSSMLENDGRSCTPKSAYSPVAKANHSLQVPFLSLRTARPAAAKPITTNQEADLATSPYMQGEDAFGD